MFFFKKTCTNKPVQYKIYIKNLLNNYTFDIQDKEKKLS